jgi:hypothetical protein
MRNEISEIGDQEAADTQVAIVPGGGATIDALQSTGRVSPAANFSDDHWSPATHRRRVVSRGGGQIIRDNHSRDASSSKNHKGLAALVGEASQCGIDTHEPAAGLSDLIPDDHRLVETQYQDVVGGEAGHQGSDAHTLSAGLSNPITDDHLSRATHAAYVVGNGEASQAINDTQEVSAGLSVIIEEIREQWRRRQIWHRAEKSLTLQAKACCRRLVEGDKIKANALLKAAYTKCDNELTEVAFAATFPLVEAGKSVELHRKAVEKRLIKLASQLPIAGFILNLRGVGLLSLAGIIGEAGDLSAYSNPAKLWKRMGMGLVDGERQRRVCDAEAAIKHGYNPSRRSHMWNIGSCIIKAGGPLKDLYAERKEYELTKPETASKLHAHRKAQRYVEKRLLRDMWFEWRKH